MRGLKLLSVTFMLAASLPGGWSASVTQAAPLVSCRAVTLYLQPGFNPPLAGSPVQIAPDAPHGSYPVSLPVYPGAVRLSKLLGTPYGVSTGDTMYLQTAAVEYRSADAPSTVQRWYQRAMPSCGWRQGGFSGPSSTFPSGNGFVSKSNQNLIALVSMGPHGSSGSYLALGVEEEILPPRPAASYLHGPFSQLRIALKRGSMQNQQMVYTVTHATVTDHGAIARLVSTINSIQGRRSMRTFCPGPQQLTGPAWLSFVRANGSVARAFEQGPGSCGDLAVNGIAGMIDPGGVWKQVLALSGRRA